MKITFESFSSHFHFKVVFILILNPLCIDLKKASSSSGMKRSNLFLRTSNPCCASSLKSPFGSWEGETKQVICVSLVLLTHFLVAFIIIVVSFSMRNVSARNEWNREIYGVGKREGDI